MNYLFLQKRTSVTPVSKEDQGSFKFSLWEGDEANPHGNHFQTHAGQDGDLK